jgi:lysophospholipase L1-like esterase
VRESVKLAQAHGAAVGFVWLPESSEFRGWYTPDTERHCREYITKLCDELGTPLIDARTWAADTRLTDGFHLSRAGAAEFTRKLGPAVVRAFPTLGGTP